MTFTVVVQPATNSSSDVFVDAINSTNRRDLFCDDGA
jgi:hypothetical protein